MDPTIAYNAQLNRAIEKLIFFQTFFFSSIVKLQRRIYAANLALHYFITTHWVFKNAKFLELSTVIRPEDEDFQFDRFVTGDVRKYFITCMYGKYIGRLFSHKEHIFFVVDNMPSIGFNFIWLIIRQFLIKLGARRYLLHEKDENLPKARRNYKRFVAFPHVQRAHLDSQPLILAIYMFTGSHLHIMCWQRFGIRFCSI